jgi:hypothetical protein
MRKKSGPGIRDKKSRSRIGLDKKVTKKQCQNISVCLKVKYFWTLFNNFCQYLFGSKFSPDISVDPANK